MQKEKEENKGKLEEAITKKGSPLVGFKNEKDVESRESKEDIPEVKPGMLVRIYEKIKELDVKGNPKEKIQVFEGIVLGRHGGHRPGATITVRKIATDNIGVEKIYPVYSPGILKIDIVKEYKVKRAKLYYLRDYKKKLKEKK